MRDLNGGGVGQVVWVETVSSQLANHETKVILWNCLTHRRSSWLAWEIGGVYLCTDVHEVR